MRCLLIAAIACVARAQGDPLHDYEEEAKKARLSAKKLDEEFQRRFNDAYLAFRQPVELAEAQPDRHTDAVWDYTEFRRLYDDAAAPEIAAGRAAVAFGKSGHPKALARLFDDLLDTAKEVDALEAELLAAKPIQRRYLFDLRPGVRRHALGFRETALVEAIAACPGAAAFLGETGFRQAAAKDGRKSILRRVAVLDALGLAGDAAARAPLEFHLASEESSLRIAALEALARLGGPAPPLLRMLEDPSPPVVRALLDAVRERLPKDATWIVPLVASLEKPAPFPHSRAVAALEALTRQTFGHDAARWAEWLAVYRKEIEAGSFDAAKVEVQEAKPAPPPGAVPFYGLSAAGSGLLFVVDGSMNLFLPADLAFQLTKYKTWWPTSKQDWQAEHPTHRTVFLRELSRAVEAMPKGGAWNLVALHGAFEAEPLSPKKMLKPGKQELQAAQKMIEKLEMYGWCAVHAGLLQAMRSAGMPPEERDFPAPVAETILLVAAGGPAGGHYMSPEAVVAAFRRLNRFRRLTVHAVRICDDKEPGETLLKGIADASGGSYVRMRAP
jgi:HEAT repeat protein